MKKKRPKRLILPDLDQPVHATTPDERLRTDETEEGKRILEATWGGHDNSNRLFDSQNNHPG
jgi:hypothetical protein